MVLIRSQSLALIATRPHARHSSSFGMLKLPLLAVIGVFFTHRKTSEYDVRTLDVATLYIL